MLKLCLITQYQAQQSLAEYLAFIEKAVQGGVTMVQLRDKEQTPAALKQMALALKHLLHQYQVPLLINDHVTLVKEIDADGVHLGQEDMPVAQARKLLGTDKIIGLSIETLVQLQQSNDQDVNYVTASAIYPSQTKTNCKTIWGLQGLQKLVQQAKHPVTAIGGITAQNAREVIAAGAKGIAVVSAIHQAADPKQAASLLISEVEYARAN